MRTRAIVAVGAAALLALTGGTRADEGTAASANSEPSGEAGSSEHLEKHAPINAETNALLAGAGTNAPAPAQKSFAWKFSWEGWDGLRTEISQKTSLNDPLAKWREKMQGSNSSQVFHFEELKMSGTIGALVEVDGAAYRTDGNLDLPNDIQLRRARIKAQGDCVLLLPVGYKIELGYIPHKFNLNEAWFASERMDYIGYIKAGAFAPPMGLDLVNSSRDLTFMEPATTLQALAPANEAGIQIGHPVFDQRGTWNLGIFGGGLIATEYGNASQDYGNLIGRFTWLAIDHLAPPDRPAENRLLHLGLSANVQYSASSAVRYQSRPESYLAEQVIDTGKIDASASGALATEAAYVNGPFSLQGEFIDSIVRQNNGDSLNFFGFYANAGWYLTGESRPYDRVNGCFKRLIPRRNFDFGRGGAWGAFEVASRFSYTDLDAGDIHGGRIWLLTGELKWYLHSHVRWMFNAGGGQVNGGPHDGKLLLFQTRVGVDF